MASFSRQDLATLKEMARAHRATPTPVQGKPKKQPPPPDIRMAPEVYVAKPQSGSGIAALTGSTPGSGPCDIYQVNTSGVLAAVSGLARTVYNLSTTAITQDFFTVKRDKFGKWIASTPSGSQAGQVAAVLLGEVDGTLASETSSFTATDLVVLSPAGAPSPGSTITVQNILNFPAANDDKVLIFRSGTSATYYGIPHPSRTDCT